MARNCVVTEAAAYEFGAGRGIITYTFPPNQRPEMKRDTVALGFVTSVSDAVLVRIESASSNDYLEIEIVSNDRIIRVVVHKPLKQCKIWSHMIFLKTITLLMAIG